MTSKKRKQKPKFQERVSSETTKTVRESVIDNGRTVKRKTKKSLKIRRKTSGTSGTGPRLA